jgi:hypothetical protein
MFTNTPVPGLVAVSDDGMAGFLNEVSAMGTSPLTKEQRAMVILVLAGAVFPQPTAIQICRSLFVLMDEGLDNLTAHLMLVEAGVE